MAKLVVTLSQEQVAFLRESLRYTRQKFEDYRYPNETFRAERIAEVNAIVSALSKAKKVTRR